MKLESLNNILRVKVKAKKLNLLFGKVTSDNQNKLRDSDSLKKSFYHSRVDGKK